MWKSVISAVVFAWSILVAPAAENHSNKIDVIIANTLKRQRQEMPKPISDEKFIRRAYIDIVGRIPTFWIAKVIRKICSISGQTCLELKKD